MAQKGNESRLSRGSIPPGIVSCSDSRRKKGNAHCQAGPERQREGETGPAGREKERGMARGWAEWVAGVAGPRGNGERSRVGPEEREGKEWAFGPNREKKREVFF